MTFIVVIEACYYNSSCSKKTLTLRPLMQLSILITIFHAHKFCVLYQRVGRHSIQEWRRHVTYTILDQKPRKINHECVEAQTSTQCTYSVLLNRLYARIDQLHVISIFTKLFIQGLNRQGSRIKLYVVKKGRRKAFQDYSESRYAF